MGEVVTLKADKIWSGYEGSAAVNKKSEKNKQTKRASR